jgi:hypothetical protein
MNWLQNSRSFRSSTFILALTALLACAVPTDRLLAAAADSHSSPGEKERALISVL